jgi:hypothetical protein
MPTPRCWHLPDQLLLCFTGMRTGTMVTRRCRSAAAPAQSRAGARGAFAAQRQALVWGSPLPRAAPLVTPHHASHCITPSLRRTLDGAEFVNPEDLNFESQEWLMPDEPQPKPEPKVCVCACVCWAVCGAHQYLGSARSRATRAQPLNRKPQPADCRPRTAAAARGLAVPSCQHNTTRATARPAAPRAARAQEATRRGWRGC